MKEDQTSKRKPLKKGNMEVLMVTITNKHGDQQGGKYYKPRGDIMEYLYYCFTLIILEFKVMYCVVLNLM